MNKKAANIQTLTRLGPARGPAESRPGSPRHQRRRHPQTPSIQIADIVVQVSEAIPVIMADLKALAALVAKMTAPNPPSRL